MTLRIKEWLCLTFLIGSFGHFYSCSEFNENLRTSSPVPERDIHDAKNLDAVRFGIPEDYADRKYLDLPSDGSFSIVDIRADVILLNVFSSFCSHCQAEAPNTNKLYKAILESPDLKKRIRIIGIGAGNSQEDVTVFRKKYGVPFPLFPDKDKRATSQLGVSATPTMIGIFRNSQGEADVFLVITGGIGVPAAFLEILREKLSGHQASEGKALSR